MSDDFERFIEQQFPFRPDHPDFERLQQVVAQVEKMKAEGLTPEQAYDKIIDVYSMSYLAINRSGMNIPDEPTVSRMKAVEYMANGWTEGFLYGVLYARLAEAPKD